MNSFAAWGLTILGLAVVTTIAEMLLPKGKTRNVIRSVAATIAVLVIVTPLPSLLKSGFKFEFPDGSVQMDDEYLEYTDGLKRKPSSARRSRTLRKKGIRKALLLPWSLTVGA